MPSIRAICHPPPTADTSFLGWEYRLDELVKPSSRARPMTEYVGKPVYIEHNDKQQVGYVAAMNINELNQIICDIEYDISTPLGKKLAEDMKNRKLNEVSIGFKADKNEWWEATGLIPVEISIVEKGAMDTPIMHFDTGVDEHGNYNLYYNKPLIDQLANSMSSDNFSQNKQSEMNVTPLADKKSDSVQQSPSFDLQTLATKYPTLTATRVESLLQQEEERQEQERLQLSARLADKNTGVAAVFKEFVDERTFEEEDFEKLGRALIDSVNHPDPKSNTFMHALCSATSNHRKLKVEYEKAQQEKKALEEKLNAKTTEPAKALQDEAMRKRPRNDPTATLLNMFTLEKPPSTSISVKNSNNLIEDAFVYNPKKAKQDAADLPVGFAGSS